MALSARGGGGFRGWGLGNKALKYANFSLKKDRLILKTKDLATGDPDNKGLSEIDPDNKGLKAYIPPINEKAQLLAAPSLKKFSTSILSIRQKSSA